MTIQLETYLLAFLLYFSTYAYADMYEVIRLDWDRPLARVSGEPIRDDEPLTYDIFCDISSTDIDGYQLCGVGITDEFLIYQPDPALVGRAGGNVNFQGIACDASTDNCSELSNIVVRTIKYIPISAPLKIHIR